MFRLGSMVAVVLVSGAALRPTDACAAWSSVQSANVRVVGDVSEARLREVALTVERFREVLERVLPNIRLLDTAPTVVVVFDSDRAMRPYKPIREGRVDESVEGLLIASEDVNYVLLSRDAAALEFVLGPYAMLLLHSTMPGVPVWLVNGLGWYHSTFTMSAESLTGTSGTVPKALLPGAREPLLPLETVLAAGTNSPLYRDEGQRRDFDRTCWALVSYILGSIPQGTSLLSTYLGMTMGGTSSIQAFDDTFHLNPADLTSTLQQYLSRSLGSPATVRFDEPSLKFEAARVETLTEAQRQARMADIFVTQSNDAQAERTLALALASTPPHADALLARGRLRLRQRRPTEAWPDLERAAAEAPNDYRIQYTLGITALSLVASRPAVVDRARLQAGLVALDRAARLEPRSAEALYAKARTILLLGAELEQARQSAEEASELGPGREEYRLLLAEIALKQGDIAAARDALGTLAARASRLEIVQRARTIMAEVTKADLAASASATAGPGASDGAARSTGDATAPPSDATPASAAPNRDRLSAVASPGGRYELALREVGPGERRSLGSVSSIECGALGVLFHTTMAGRTVRLFTPAFEAVQFVTYRDSVEGTVACGTQGSLDHVFLTWRPPANSRTRMGGAYDGEIVAVELLPRDYTPEP